jgi:hypothetical protein
MRSYFEGGVLDFPVVPKVWMVRKIPAASMVSSKGSLFILNRYFIADGILFKFKAKKEPR